MNPSELSAIVGKLPDPDERGLLSKIDKKVVDQVVEEIHKGGRDALTALIDMLVVPGKGDDMKPHYALHCLALRACAAGEDQRREFAQIVASQVGGDRPKGVRQYLACELQVAGGAEVVPALGKLLLDEELCESAAQSLVAIGNGAAEQLRAALPQAKGKCRLTLVQNLGVVKDAQASGALKEALGDENQDVRLTAAWGLANIGDAGAVDAVVKLADVESGWGRINATNSCLLLAENLLAAGKKDEAARVYNHLKETRTDPSERYILEAAKIYALQKQTQSNP
jgi:HEAT repeat protein